MDRNDDRFITFHWLLTYMCNFNCPYCSMPHKRENGHAFDSHRPEEWAERYKSFEVPYALYITGGEPLLDTPNFIRFYENIIRDKNLQYIRIDTNGSVNYKKLTFLNSEKTVLNISYHPSQISFDKYFVNLDGYRELGLDVTMVNMVCYGRDIPKYKSLKKVFSERGYTLNPGIYIGSNYTYTNNDIDEYSSVLDKFDTGLKTGVLSPKGLECRASAHFISVTPQGSVSNCWTSLGNLFEDFSLPIHTNKRLCPYKECNCIEKYSLLSISGRSVRNALKDYTSKAILPEIQNRTKIISIVGYFGDNNAGDEALLQSLISRLRTVPNVQPVVIAFTRADDVAQSHNVFAIDGTDNEKVSSLLRLSDAVILGPGGLLEDYAQLDAKAFFHPDQGIYRYLYPVTLAHLYGKPVIGYGLGVGPLFLQESRNAIKLALSDFEKIFLRDSASYELLDEMGLSNISLSSDAVLSLNSRQVGFIGIDKKNEFNNKDIIGVSLRPFAGLNSESVLEELSTLIAYLIDNSSANIVLVPMQYEYDFPILKELYNRICSKTHHGRERVLILRERYAPEELLGLISSFEIMIGMRLHSIVMAAASNVPFVALSYDRKVNEFTDSIEMSRYVLNVNEIKAEELLNLVIELIDSPNKEITSHYHDLVSNRKKLEQTAWSLVEDRICNLSTDNSV